MANTFGFGSDSTGFSDTIVDNIQKSVIQTLRAGLIALPKGTVAPGIVIAQKGTNFTIRVTAYPDLEDTTGTDPLTEGVAPLALKLGIDTQDFTVTQIGARTTVTDIAQMQSPHDLKAIAADKIARLAAETIDSKARVALATVASAGDYGSPLDSLVVGDAIAAMQDRNIAPVPGAGYFFLMHPYALRGLTSEDGLNGYVNVVAEQGGDLSFGAVGQWRGATFVTSTKFVDTAGAYPVYVLGAGSMAAGDVSTLSYHYFQGAQVGNELDQLAGVGFKGIFGVAPLSLAESADGTGSNDSATSRVFKFTVAGGLMSGIVS